MNLLYILLGVSILAPIYSYAIYPYILRLFPKKSLRADSSYFPSVTVLIVKTEGITLAQKKENVETSDYSNIVEVVLADGYNSARNLLNRLKGDVIVITNTSSIYKTNTISKLVSTMSDVCIGCVCGMSRKMPDKDGNFNDGANWVYENRIKVMESNLGTLSGANAAVYAVRKKLLPEHICHDINLDFFLPTHITECGYDVLFQPEAVAYEIDEQTEDSLFHKHVIDGRSARQSMLHFWRFLLPRKGSFVFISHRVMKWLVPFNLLFILGCCLCLSEGSGLFSCLSWIQLIGYIYIIMYHLLFVRNNKSVGGIIGKLSDFACYFMTLNLAWFLGLFKIKI